MVTRLREIAREQGLQALGVAPAVDEVRAVFGWAESVVCAAVCYLPPEPGQLANTCHPERSEGSQRIKSPHSQALSAEANAEILRLRLRMTEAEAWNDGPRGLVARFARGADYHDVLRAKLEPVAEAIRAEGGRAEVCVDTTPIPERKLAVLAGIAWRGWNGNVFVDGCGSWASLGEVVTDLELPRGEPLSIDRCRDCGRCVRHCPTKAIKEPYVVDTSRCLSRLTQMSGVVPEEMRGLMGSRIYGCDVCQEVCPQNVGVKSVVPEFAEERFPGACPEVVPLIGLTPEEFRERVKNGSIGWIRRTRIRRNAAIAAGNLRSREAVPALREMLDDPDPVPRECAEWALREIEAES